MAPRNDHKPTALRSHIAQLECDIQRIRPPETIVSAVRNRRNRAGVEAVATGTWFIAYRAWLSKLAVAVPQHPIESVKDWWQRNQLLKEVSPR